MAICEYALINEVPLYNALNYVQTECLKLFRLMDSYLKKCTATKKNFMTKKLCYPFRIFISFPQTELKASEQRDCRDR